MEQYRHHPLTEAARNNDAIAEEVGLGKAIQTFGLNMAALFHVAEQRALRLTLLTSRGEAAMREVTSSIKPMPVALTADEEALSKRFTIALLDGICIGWRGREIDLNNEETN